MKKQKKPLYVCDKKPNQTIDLKRFISTFTQNVGAHATHTHTHASAHAVLKKHTSSDTMISGLLKSTDFRK